MYLEIAVFALVRICPLPKFLFNLLNQILAQSCWIYRRRCSRKCSLKTVLIVIVVVTSMQNIILYLLTMKLFCYSLALACSKVIRCLKWRSYCYSAYLLSLLYIAWIVNQELRSVRWASHFPRKLCKKNKNSSNTTVLTQNKRYFNKRSHEKPDSVLPTFLTSCY